MTYTEDEAKEKWCPFARQIVGGAGAAASGNRDTNCDGPLAVHDGNRCIGSACMAWRWEEDKEGGTAYKNTPLKDSPGHFENNPLGYCGLAGAQ